MAEEVRENYDEEFDVDLSDILSDGDVEADQPEAEPEQDETKPEEGNGADEKPDGAEADQPGQPGSGETFHLKWMEETRDVSRDEVVQLAQKGMDYDRMRSQRDEAREQTAELKKFRDEHREALTELQDFMDEYGLDNAADVFDAMRVGRLTQQGIGRELAAARVAQGRAERKLARQTSQAAPQKSEQDKLREKAEADVKAFGREHPDVDLNELLPKLADELKTTPDLERAYFNYERKRLEKEAEEARKALEAEKQNNKNRQRSAGSQASAGGDTGNDDPFLKYFMSD